MAIWSPLFFSKIWVVIYGRKFSEKRLWSLLFFQETPVTAAKFLRNAGNRRYLCTKYLRFRVFFPPICRYRTKISTKISTRAIIVHDYAKHSKIWSRSRQDFGNAAMVHFIDMLLVEKFPKESKRVHCLKFSRKNQALLPLFKPTRTFDQVWPISDCWEINKGCHFLFE